ncbi:MAG: hypothetical protein EBU90_07120 [Proteobacteria bacterium]|nr:hypothetical protein [Pseudomonadota bacterium]NBP14185.1 hypothetical protein [bacterium]
MNDWEKLRQHVINHGIIFGDNVNNKRYAFFLDIRQALQTAGYLKIAGQLLWQQIKKYQPEVLVGQGYGAANLLMAVQIAAEQDGLLVNTLIGRDKRKLRNRRRIFEGPRPSHYARAVYLDDAFNTGATYNKCLRLLKEEGINLDIRAIGVLYDFWNHKGTRLLEILGMPVHRIFTRHDLGITRIDPVDSPLESKLIWRNLAYNQWRDYLKSPPLIVDDRVYWANDRHEVFCQRLEDGEIIWHQQGPYPRQLKGISARPVCAGNLILISSYDGYLYAYCRDTGSLVWKKKLDLFLHSTPWVDEIKREIYIGTEGGLHYKRGDILGMDLDSGVVKWRFPTQDVNPGSPIKIADQVICTSNDGYMYSLTDGVLNWATYVGTVKGRPNVIEDVIIIATDEGHLYGLDFKGKFLWSRFCGTRSLHQFLPVHESGLVYIVNQDHFCLAFDQYGNQKWIRKLRGPGLWNIQLYKDELIIVCENGYAVCLDALTGLKKNQSWLKYRVNCPVDFNDKYLAVHSITNGLFVYERNIC